MWRDERRGLESVVALETTTAARDGDATPVKSARPEDALRDHDASPAALSREIHLRALCLLAYERVLSARRRRFRERERERHNTRGAHSCGDVGQEVDEALDAVRERLLSFVRAAAPGVKRLVLEPCVDLLIEPELFTYRHARSVVEGAQEIPLEHHLEAALSHARRRRLPHSPLG